MSDLGELPKAEESASDTEREAKQPAAKTAKETSIVMTGLDAGPGPLLASQPSSRGEVSAATIGRMLGLATAGELGLLEGKLDLLTTKLNAITVKLDRAVTLLGSAPTGADLERIDVQLGSLKNLIREALGAGSDDSAKPAEATPKKAGPKIVSSSSPKPEEQ